jgi:hypothetical protein
MNKQEGGCLCGSVRYEFEAAPLLTAICHCRNCQKQAGSAFSLIVGLPAQALVLSGDTLAMYQDQGQESGKPVRRYFCRACGSPIKSEGDQAPGLVFIKAGTLDDTSWLAPSLAIWCDSAQPWLRLAPELPACPRNPPL